jgi:hypothetical protein
MREGLLLMSAKERARKGILERVRRGELTVAGAGEAMGVSERQTKRIWARYKAEGDAGLVHRGRGRPSGRAYAAGFREEALALCRGPLSGMGPTLTAEKLAEEGYAVDHETLRRWLIEDGQWHKRRRRAVHRQRRERRARFGQMLQLDGSHHAWFGPEHPHACLMSLVDDATGTAMTLLAGEETTEAAMRLLWKWVLRYGVPESLYLDKKSVYLALERPTEEEQAQGQKRPTHFGAACEKLGIRLIYAHSPQAKGRVERKHALYQDRFLHELRLQGIRTIDGANALIDGGFDDALNAKFARAPREPQDAHQPLPRKLDLRDVFCRDEPRTLANDYTVRHANRYYQVLKLNDPMPRPKDKLTVRTWLDGTLTLHFQGKPLVFNTLDAPPPKPSAKPTPAPPAPPRKPHRPHPQHPWRRRP